MKPIRVVRLGTAEASLLASIATAFRTELQTAVSISERAVDIGFAHHPERNQYHSTAIIEHLARLYGQNQELVLAVTESDLYIPILTFVFGEAQLGANIAVVSYHRLEQEFYGLPSDPGLLRERLLKEAFHEIGHMLGLTHCDDYQCVMAATHAVEWVDMKGSTFCEQCRQTAGISRRTAAAPH